MSTQPKNKPQYLYALIKWFSLYKSKDTPQKTKNSVAKLLKELQIQISEGKWLEIKINPENNNLFLHILDCFSHRADEKECEKFLERVEPFMLNYVELDEEYNQLDSKPFDLQFWSTYIKLCSTKEFDLSTESRERFLKDTVLQSKILEVDQRLIYNHISAVADQIKATQKKKKSKGWVDYFNDLYMERYWFQFFEPRVNNAIKL